MVNNKKTIKEIADIWKEDKRQYVKQSTMAVYLLSLKNHLLPFLEVRWRLRKMRFRLLPWTS